MRRLRNAVLLVLLTVAIVELIARLALRATGTYPQHSFHEQYATTNCLKTDEFNYGKYARDRGGLDVMLGKAPHPFFGFVVNQGPDCGRDRQCDREGRERARRRFALTSQHAGESPSPWTNRTVE